MTSTRHIMTSSTELVFRVGGRVSLELTVPPHASGGWISYRYLSTVSLHRLQRPRGGPLFNASYQFPGIVDGSIVSLKLAFTVGGGIN